MTMKFYTNCGDCGKPYHISWDYCPHCGEVDYIEASIQSMTKDLSRMRERLADAKKRALSAGGPFRYDVGGMVCTPEDFPTLIKQLREAAGVKQVDMAKVLGYRSAATVSHYESGRRKIPLSDLRRMAAATGYTLEIHLIPAG